MSSLKDLEHDVHQFLSTLANVRRVEVKASAPRGKKRLEVRTYVKNNSPENRNRVRVTEEVLVERHQNVDFTFSITTLKDEHEPRTVGTT